VLGNHNGTVKSIYCNRKFLDSTSDIPEGTTFGLILDRTSFYAESGGQEYDTGSIVIDGVADFEVTNVQVFSGYVLHIGHLKYGQIDVGHDVVCSYDEVEVLLWSVSIAAVLTCSQLRRWPLRNNHTATHILNYALREVLGDHIDQKGSLVAPTKLRFDFSHKAQIAVSELKHIESISQGWIAENVRVFSKDLDLATAQRISGLRAVFGESYPDPVRVVSLRWDVDEIAKDIENPQWRSTSVEFCGGTCVSNAFKDVL
jgi:alanyl-tRNA synthetase